MEITTILIISSIVGIIRMLKEQLGAEEF